MKFFLDENFPKSATKLLSDAGHEVYDIRGTVKEGACDQEIFQMAQEQEAVFLTTDRDFFHTVPHLFPEHAGVIVIALKKPNRDAILRRMSWVLNVIPEKHFANRCFQLRDSTWLALPPL